MGYVYDCDGCDETYHEMPPFVGEFMGSFLKTDGGVKADIVVDNILGTTVTEKVKDAQIVWDIVSSIVKLTAFDVRERIKST